jgi:hypothetical protein
LIEADETPGGIPAPEPEEERGLSPGKAFLILLAVLVAGAALVLIVTSGGDEAPDEAEPRPPFQLTDEQALERFHELWALDERARVERDPTLISLIYTSDSESGRGAADALSGYLRQDLVDESEVEVLEVTLQSNSSAQVRIEVLTRVTPCIVDADGQSVLVHEPRVLERETLWTLVPEGTQWKVADKHTPEERVVEEDPNACP